MDVMAGEKTADGGPRLVMGLMSGTSVDGIDAALVEITRAGGRYGARVVTHVETKWPRRLRERLLAVMAPATSTTAEVCALNMLVARQFAEAAEACVRAAGVSPEKVRAIGSHGQTVCHLPPASGGKRAAKSQAMGSTLQLGDVSVIATLTGMTTVGNFRPADMAVGGQGAPLVPWTDDMLLADGQKTRCVQNIGGIANVTYLPPLSKREVSGWTFRTADGVDHGPGIARTRPAVVAFDTGPGNMLMDAAVSLGTGGRKGFDRGGRLAAKGKVLPRLFRELQGNPYFDRRPPKSTGRELFGRQLAEDLLRRHRKERLEHVVCTLTRLTAWSIADAYLHHLPELPDEVILCGGGADNPVLVRMLEEELAALSSEFTKPERIAVRRIDAFGIPNKAKEAASFALLAAATLDGVAGNLPSVTGAARPVVLGVVARQ
jgi:anhydro-N-acetylmuramic acid kinase